MPPDIQALDRDALEGRLAYAESRLTSLLPLPELFEMEDPSPDTEARLRPVLDELYDGKSEEAPYDLECRGVVCRFENYDDTFDWTSEDQVSFGAGIRWTPFAPRPKRPVFSSFLFPERYLDFRAFYFTAVAGANVRDRLTRMTSTQVSEDVAWSPMVSLAVGLFELQGQDWSFGPEFREQIAIYDGRLQRGWQLLLPIHLNGW